MMYDVTQSGTCTSTIHSMANNKIMPCHAFVAQTNLVTSELYYQILTTLDGHQIVGAPYWMNPTDADITFLGKMRCIPKPESVTAVKTTCFQRRDFSHAESTQQNHNWYKVNTK